MMFGNNKVSDTMPLPGLIRNKETEHFMQEKNQMVNFFCQFSHPAEKPSFIKSSVLQSDKTIQVLLNCNTIKSLQAQETIVQ